MALFYIISKKKTRHWSKIRIFPYRLAFDTPVIGPHRNIAVPFRMEKLEWCGDPMVKEV